jgi:hypothetical protein
MVRPAHVARENTAAAAQERYVPPAHPAASDVSGFRSRGFADKMRLVLAINRDGELSFSARTVATVLLLQFHNNDTGQCDPSYTMIAAAFTNMRRATVINAVHELQVRGYITILSRNQHGGSSQANAFVFDFERGDAASAPSTGTENVPVHPRQFEMRLMADVGAASAGGKVVRKAHREVRKPYQRGSPENVPTGPDSGASGTENVPKPTKNQDSTPPTPPPSGGECRQSRWDRFREAYPFRPDDRKAGAERAFRRFDEADQDWAIAAAPLYAARCRDKSSPICFAKNWLRERGFENFPKPSGHADLLAAAAEIEESGPEEWRRVCRRLRGELGDAVYRSWLGRLEFLGVDDGVARIFAPTKFIRTWVMQHHIDRIRAAVGGEFAVERVEIVLVRGVSASPAPA